MIKCPKCNQPIDHLNLYAVRPVAFCLYPDGTETEQNSYAALEEHRYECPRCGEVLANTDVKALEILNGAVTVILSKVGWKMLKQQKADILSLRDGLEGVEWTSRQQIDSLSGIIHLVDEVQDQAAEQIGEEAVFGKRDADGLTAEEGDSD